jgi:RNase P/RNase MRP subunit p29
MTKQKYNDNSSTGIEGRIIFPTLLTLKQLNHSTI